MHTLRVLAVCVGFAFALPGIADPNAEFARVFKAYQEAKEASRHIEAVFHAEKARELGEELYADDAKVIATLAFNHGYALAMFGGPTRVSSGTSKPPRSRLPASFATPRSSWMARRWPWRASGTG